MQIQQLKYLIALAEYNSYRAAAHGLFVSQSTLSTAIKNLEQETNTTIFKRTNKGIYLTDEGNELLGYAYQVVDQMELMEKRYSRNQEKEKRFVIATQHYSMVVEAFGKTIAPYLDSACDFFLNETSTEQIISEVAASRADIGLLYLSNHNRNVIEKDLAAAGLIFTPLYIARPHVFVSKQSELAEKDEITLDDLSNLVRFEQEQGKHRASYYSEEPLSHAPCSRRVRLSDNGSLVRTLTRCGGYIAATGVYYSAPDLVRLSVQTEERMEVGYLRRKGAKASAICNRFLAELASIIVQHLDTVEASPKTYELLEMSLS